ncbi:hypothetical protein Goshw_019997 [Gossypium schwendimanii]|uniref:CCHC-type domain-containing protein n=1 Tax=Gossypium schwendimanii TaxID=34291 RepID=A0A7J9NFL9_GOSSC|nr:hypothetical protein [Gossypium schwendimanii]
MSRVVTKITMTRDDISFLEEELVHLTVKISLVVPNGKPTLLGTFLFWLKIGPCPPECYKKDLTHAIGSTFRGIISSKVMGDLCHIKVELDVQKPLRRGIFILAGTQEKSWIPFKYENLPGFCFGCGRIGHKIKDCNDIPNESKELSKNDLPFFLALKAESNLIRKVSMWLGVTMKKSMPQCYYLGRSDEGRKGNTNFNTVQGRKWTSTKDNLGIREIKTNLN